MFIYFYSQLPKPEPMVVVEADLSNYDEPDTSSRFQQSAQLMDDDDWSSGDSDEVSNIMH